MWECAERCGRQRERVSALAFLTLGERSARFAVQSRAILSLLGCSSSLGRSRSCSCVQINRFCTQAAFHLESGRDKKWLQEGARAEGRQLWNEEQRAKSGRERRVRHWPQIFRGASSSSRMGWLRKISLDLIQRPRTSASVIWTIFPGRLPRTGKEENVLLTSLV